MFCCRVGRSVNRIKYEKARFQEGMSYRELERFSKTLGENISYSVFHVHFTKHIASPQLIEERIARGKIINLLNIFEDIENSLDILRKQVSDLMRKENLKPGERKVLIDILQEIRLTASFCVDSLVKYSKYMKEEERDLLKIVLYAIEPLPEEYKEKVLQRIKEVA